MSNNFNDPSNWHLLPAELVALLNCIQQGTLSYPERESHWQQAQDYLLNGNYSMAEHMFDTVRIRQENLRQGISPDLRLLMQAVQANAVNYPERGDNLQQAQDYLLNGNYSMAEHMFDTVRIRQENLRQDIPPALKLLMQAVQAGAAYYPKREDNLQQAQDYLQSGNYSMAEHMFDTVRSRQENLRQGIPPDLRLLMQAVQANAVNYPEREDNLQQAQDYLLNGNYSMAEHMFDTVRSRQDNLRQGIPPALVLLIQAVKADAVYYPEREDNLQQAQDYLQNGNYTMAEHMFDTVRSRQDNLRKIQ